MKLHHERYCDPGGDDTDRLYSHYNVFILSHDRSYRRGMYVGSMHRRRPLVMPLSIYPRVIYPTQDQWISPRLTDSSECSGPRS